MRSIDAGQWIRVVWDSLLRWPPADGQEGWREHLKSLDA